MGEDGDGAVLVAAASRTGDELLVRAVELFVGQEQQHAALVAQLLARLGAAPLGAYWSDAVFVRLRRMLGLHTELGVLLVAELIAIEYYGALRRGAPDPVVRAVAQRILLDEQQHVVFHIERLRAGVVGLPPLLRGAVAVAWWGVAAGATVVVVLDHGAALVLCGLPRRRIVSTFLRRFSRVSRTVLVPGRAHQSGVALDPFLLTERAQLE